MKCRDKIKKICGFLGDTYETPCQNEKVADFMDLKAPGWCQRNCWNRSDRNCWFKLFELLFKEDAAE